MATPLMTEIEATAADFRRLLISIVIYTVLVIALLPWASLQGPAFAPTVTLFTVWIVMADLATAFIIGSHVHRLENMSLLLLASAYLYSALMGVAHILTFPGTILHEVPFVGGPQITAYIYNGWKLGFALLVLASVLAPQPRRRVLPQGRTTLIYATVVCAAVGLIVAVGLAIDGKLPTAVTGARFTFLDIALSFTAFIAGLLVIAVLLMRDIDSLLKLWLAAAMTGFCGDLLVSTIGGGRFTLGWYFGRASGLISGCALFAFFVMRFVQEAATEKAP